MMHGANVVRLKSGRRIKLDSLAAVKLCRDEMWRSGLAFDEISRRAGIGKSTAGRIAHGDTQRPAFNTICSILGALGWDIIAEERR